MPSGSRAVSAAPISEPEQHRAGGLDRDLGDQRQRRAGRRQRPAGTDDRSLGLQQVLGGLDQDRVGAAVDQAGDLLLVGVAQACVGWCARASAASCPDPTEPSTNRG